MKMSFSDAKKLGLAIPKATNGAGKRPKATGSKGVNREVFNAMCVSHGIREPDYEYFFAAAEMQREWRFDIAWHWDFLMTRFGRFWTKLAVEIQGGNWQGGRHTRAAALIDEYEKLNAAACLGWRVLFFTPQQIESGECFPAIKRALGIQP